MLYSEAKQYLNDGMVVDIKKANLGCRLGVSKITNVRYKEIQGGYIIGDNDELEILENPDGTLWVHRDEQQFIVGDYVRVIDGKGLFKPNRPIGSTLLIDKAVTSQIAWFSDTSIGEHFYNLKKISKVEMGCSTLKIISGVNITITPPKAEKKSFMSNIIQKIKDLVLSDADRVLREQGFEDDQKHLLANARDMMLEELLEQKWAERREDVAQKLLQIKAEEK